jgi:hypothetical protein
MIGDPQTALSKGAIRANEVGLGKTLKTGEGIA